MMNQPPTINSLPGIGNFENSKAFYRDGPQ